MAHGRSLRTTTKYRILRRPKGPKGYINSKGYITPKGQTHTRNGINTTNTISNSKGVLHAKLVSFDVSALFTSIPVDKTLDIVHELLNKDNTWRKDVAESLDTDTVIKLLSFFLTTTYFVFKGDYYQQKDGCSMGSPCSPLVANAYMEHFEQLALSSALHLPRIWYRFMDDTFCVIKAAFVNEFTDHINSLDNNIRFTREKEEDGTLPFLDTLIVREECVSIKVKVYRKPTHTDQYLHLNSHHPLEHKLSVVRTLTHRAQSVVTEERDRKEEITHVKKPLKLWLRRVDVS